MSPMLFLDTNVPIYAAGRPHPLKEPCAQILLLVAQQPYTFVTSAEVFQELLHRYRSLRLWSQGRQVFDDFSRLMHDRIEPVYGRDVEGAAALADSYPALSARDLLHVMVMTRIGADHIVSTDGDFDSVPHLTRLDPANLAVWRQLVTGSTS